MMSSFTAATALESNMTNAFTISGAVFDTKIF